jgi:hypothetical protein
VGGFGEGEKWGFPGVLTEETEEDPGQGGIEMVLVRKKDLEIGLESQDVCHIMGWAGATEKVMVGFLGSALQRAPGGARLVKLKLLDLEWEDLIDPFREAFFLGE